VSAKDKATAKEQSIRITASSGLSDKEIDRMVKEADAHRDEDRRFHEVVQARNHADSLMHATRKSMHELGDKVEAGEKERIEAAIKDLEQAMKGEDKAAIEAKTQALAQASAKMAERLYAQSGAAGAGAAGAGGGAGAGGASAEGRKAGDEDVVDAEFEEVKDDKK
jgi:molecular chaperone DnaK